MRLPVYSIPGPWGEGGGGGGGVQSSRKGEPLRTHPMATGWGQDGEPGALSNPAGNLESGVLPGSALSLHGVQNSCGLLQSGKVVGVGLDLPAELAGQSGYSSAHSQGNSLSMWGEGEDKRGQISWPHGGCHWSSGYQRGLGPGP